jgi:hypothetical protein
MSAASAAFAAQKSNRASASSVSRSWTAFAAIERRQLVEDPLDLLLLRGLRLAPGVAELDRDHRLDEQRRAAAGRVVDDALDPGPRLGLDRDHVAAVAERDDRLLERAAQLRAHERVEPPPQPVVRDTNRRPQPAEARRRGVEQLADRVEAAGERRADGRQRMELAGERVEQRPAVVGDRRLEAGGRVERVGDLEELGGVETAAAGRALDGGTDIVRPADPDAGTFGEQGAGLVGLVEAAGDDHRVRRGFERRRQPLRRWERGRGREPLADERELEQRDRAGVHGRQERDERPGAVAQGRDPDTAGLAGSTKRHGTAVQGGPAYGDPDPGRRDDVRSRLAGRMAASMRSGEPSVEQVEPGHRAVDREAGRDESRSPGEQRVWGCLQPRRLALLRAGVSALAPRSPPRESGVADRVGALDGLHGATRIAAGRPGASVTMFRQSYIP